MKNLGVKCLVVLAVTSLSVYREAWACSVCFGDPSSKMSQGVFAAVYLLLGVVILVLGGIAWTAVTWVMRSKKIASSQMGGLRSC